MGFTIWELGIGGGRLRHWRGSPSTLGFAIWELAGVAFYFTIYDLAGVAYDCTIWELRFGMYDLAGVAYDFTIWDVRFTIWRGSPTTLAGVAIEFGRYEVRMDEVRFGGVCHRLLQGWHSILGMGIYDYISLFFFFWVCPSTSSGTTPTGRVFASRSHLPSSKAAGM